MVYADSCNSFGRIHNFGSLFNTGTTDAYSLIYNGLDSLLNNTGTIIQGCTITLAPVIEQQDCDDHFDPYESIIVNHGTVNNFDEISLGFSIIEPDFFNMVNGTINNCGSFGTFLFYNTGTFDIISDNVVGSAPSTINNYGNFYGEPSLFHNLDDGVINNYGTSSVF